MHLSPVFEEVLAEDVLGGVLVLQHLGKECGHLLSFGAELHVLTWKCWGWTFCQRSGRTSAQLPDNPTMCPRVRRSQPSYRRSKTWRCWAEARREAQTPALCVPETSTWRRLCISLLPTLKPNQISRVISSLILAVQWNTTHYIHALPREICRVARKGSPFPLLLWLLLCFLFSVSNDSFFVFWGFYILQKQGREFYFLFLFKV